jgi:hypothetical protein
MKWKALPYNNDLSKGGSSSEPAWVTPMMEVSLKGEYTITLFTNIASLQTTFQFKHPKENNAFYEEYGMWSNVLQCKNHTVTMLFQHRGLNLKFPYNIPSGLLQNPLISSPTLSNSLFRHPGAPNTCSAKHQLNFVMNNTTPFDISLMDNTKDEICSLLNKVDTATSSTINTYAPGCMHGSSTPLSSTHSFQCTKFSSKKGDAYGFINTTQAINEVYDTTATVSSTGTGCQELNSAYSNFPSGTTAWKKTNGWEMNSSTLFKSSIYIGNRQSPFVIKKTNASSSSSIDLSSVSKCNKVDPIVEKQSKATSPKIQLKYTDKTMKSKIKTIKTIILDDWSDKLHSKFGQAILPVSPSTHIRIGGTGFVIIILCLTIGLIGCTTCCTCLIYRDGLFLKSCCSGCGQGQLPFGLNKFIPPPNYGMNNNQVMDANVEMKPQEYINKAYEAAPSSASSDSPPPTIVVP